MFKSLRQPLALFGLCSLLIHLLTYVGVNQVEVRPPRPLNDQVEVVIRDLNEDKNSDKRPNKSAQQIVEQQQRLNEEKDDQAKFLSAFDQKVVKQTRAANLGRFQNSSGTMGSKATPTQAPQPNRPKTSRDKSKGELPSLAALRPDFVPSPVAPQEQSASSGSAGAPAATDDHLKDVEVGLQTMLSTREFVYYSYYSRIKEKIRQHWEPNIREKVKMIFRQGRSIASSKDHVTQVIIVLNPQGELIRIDVLTPSGLEALDQAAVDAFRSAQPFPNPPKGLIEPDGTIKIRWDFVLEASSFQPQRSFEHFAKEMGDENDFTRRL